MYDLRHLEKKLYLPEIDFASVERKDKFISFLRFRFPKPVDFDEAFRYGPKVIAAYVAKEYILPEIARICFARGQPNRPKWKEVGDRIVSTFENQANQFFREKIEDISPMGWVAYQYGVGTSLDFEFYTTTLTDSHGRQIETHVFSRKYGESEPSDEVLKNAIRYAVVHKKPLVEDQRSTYETLYQTDFDILALEDRTNGDAEKFIDLPTLRRWPVRDRWHLIGQYPVIGTRQITVDGRVYTVNIRRSPYKLKNGMPVPVWKKNEFWENLLFSLVYKTIDFGYNLIPIEGVRSAVKQNFAKEQYKATAALYRTIFPSGYANRQLSFEWE